MPTQKKKRSPSSKKKGKKTASASFPKGGGIPQNGMSATASAAARASVVLQSIVPRTSQTRGLPRRANAPPAAMGGGASAAVGGPVINILGPSPSQYPPFVGQSDQGIKASSAVPGAGGIRSGQRSGVGGPLSSSDGPSDPGGFIPNVSTPSFTPDDSQYTSPAGTPMRQKEGGGMDVDSASSTGTEVQEVESPPHAPPAPHFAEMVNSLSNHRRVMDEERRLASVLNSRGIHTEAQLQEALATVEAASASHHGVPQSAPPRGGTSTALVPTEFRNELMEMVDRRAAQMIGPLTNQVAQLENGMGNLALPLTNTQNEVRNLRDLLFQNGQSHNNLLTQHGENQRHMEQLSSILQQNHADVMNLREETGTRLNGLNANWQRLETETASQLHNLDSRLLEYQTHNESRLLEYRAQGEAQNEARAVQLNNELVSLRGQLGSEFNGINSRLIQNESHFAELDRRTNNQRLLMNRMRRDEPEMIQGPLQRARIMPSPQLMLPAPAGPVGSAFLIENGPSTTSGGSSLASGEPTIRLSTIRLSTTPAATLMPETPPQYNRREQVDLEDTASSNL